MLPRLRVSASPVYNLAAVVSIRYYANGQFASIERRPAHQFQSSGVVVSFET
jgi:hypothetical protein